MKLLPDSYRPSNLLKVVPAVSLLKKARIFSRSAIFFTSNTLDFFRKCYTTKKTTQPFAGRKQFIFGFVQYIRLFFSEYFVGTRQKVSRFLTSLGCGRKQVKAMEWIDAPSEVSVFED